MVILTIHPLILFSIARSIILSPYIYRRIPHIYSSHWTLVFLMHWPDCINSSSKGTLCLERYAWITANFFSHTKRPGNVSRKTFQGLGLEQDLSLFNPTKSLTGLNLKHRHSSAPPTIKAAISMSRCQTRLPNALINWWMMWQLYALLLYVKK